ncbi:MAG: EMC3/TMCO1 family protein [Thermoplasmata archaeon]
MAEEKPSMGSSPLMMMMFMLLMMLVLFDPRIREAMGMALDPVFTPLLGFDYRFPLITLFLAGLMSITFSTVLRHFTTDWMELARTQKVQSTFNKEMRDARLKNDAAKLKKLQEKQPEIMKMSLKLSSSQMKLMPITMIFVIPIFVWLSLFMYRLPVITISVPWAPKVSLIVGSVCFFPNWIILYSLLSIPFSQILQRLLKLYKFRDKMAELPEE